jgi:hypothetical protein
MAKQISDRTDFGESIKQSTPGALQDGGQPLLITWRRPLKVLFVRVPIPRTDKSPAPHGFAEDRRDWHTIKPRIYKNVKYLDTA